MLKKLLNLLIEEYGIDAVLTVIRNRPSVVLTNGVESVELTEEQHTAYQGLDPIPAIKYLRDAGRLTLGGAKALWEHLNP